MCLKLFLQLSQFDIDGNNVTTDCCGIGLLQFDCLLKIFNVLGSGFLPEHKFHLEIHLQVMKVVRESVIFQKYVPQFGLPITIGFEEF